MATIDEAVMNMVSHRITISRKRLYEGVAAIVGVGHGEFAGKSGQYWVSDEALTELDRLGIGYRVLSGPKRERPKVEASTH